MNEPAANRIEINRASDAQPPLGVATSTKGPGTRLGPYRSNCLGAIVTAQVPSEAAVSKGQAGPLCKFGQHEPECRRAGVSMQQARMIELNKLIRPNAERL
jgi:hypothetical protein